MKKGFTLAEVLVTLGIIGVVAALVMPAAQKLIPDKTKAQYLKTYDTISTTVKSIASNSKLYASCSQNTQASCNEYPLLNTELPVDNRYREARYSGDAKFCNLMAEALGGENVNCRAGVYAFNAGAFNNYFRDNVSFITPNGMRWMIVPQIATYINNFEGRYQTDIYVDIDPSKNSPDCIYNEDTCQNPDIFKFMVAANGRVAPADPKGDMYTETRSSLLKKDKEIENHEIANQLGADRIFLYKQCDGTVGTPCTPAQHWVDNVGCEGGDNSDELRDCLKGIEAAMGIGEACGLKMNEYRETIDGTNDVITVKLLNGAAQSAITWKPYVGIVKGGVQYIISGFSCTIPVGGTTCSIPMSALRAANPNAATGSLSIPPVINGGNYKYIETVFPHFDNTFIYYSGINTWEYFQYDLFDYPDYQK